MSGQKIIDGLNEALADFDAAMLEIGGCGDGGCVIVRPNGQHTNGGCRCYRDKMTMQRFAIYSNRFVAAIRARIKKGEGDE